MRHNRMVITLMAALVLMGCAHHNPILPVHDEVLVYPLAYDLTYLRTLDALMTVPGWDLETTDKEKGLIRVRNVEYSRVNDADKRLATFLLKRLNGRETSVELERDSQQVLGAGTLIKAVSAQLSREVQS